MSFFVRAPMWLVSVAMGSLLPVLAQAAPALSDADPAFASPVSTLQPRLKVMQSESSVVVEIAAASGEKVGDYSVSAVGDRVEVSLKGLAMAPETLVIQDELAKRVELLVGRRPRLSVQLRHGKTTTKKIAESVQVSVTDTGLRVVLPRKQFATAAAAPPVTPVGRAADTESAAIAPDAQALVARAEATPDLTAGPVAKVAAATGPQDVPPRTNAVAAPPMAQAATATAPAPAPSIASLPVPTIETAASVEVAKTVSLPTFPMAITAPSELPRATVSHSSAAGGMAQMFLVLLVLAGCGILVFWARRRTKLTSLGQSIRVLSSRSLGPRTRLVLVGAGRRTFLLSVGDKGARVLCRWAKGQKRADAEVEAEFFAAGDAEMPELPEMEEAAETLADPSTRGSRASWKAIMEEEANNDGEDEAAPATVKESPLISGLLKLRGARTGSQKGPIATANTVALQMTDRIVHARRNGVNAR